MHSSRLRGRLCIFQVFLIIALLVSPLTPWIGEVHATPLKQGLSYPAQINKGFDPISIIAGQVSRFSVTIYNPNSFQLDNAAWSDDLVGVQPGIYISDPANISTDCGAGSVVTANPLTTTLSLIGGTVPPRWGTSPGRCTVSIDVTSTTPGNLINTLPIGASPPLGGGGDVTNPTPASATLQVGSVQAPSLSKIFNPTTIFVVPQPAHHNPAQLMIF